MKAQYRTENGRLQFEVAGETPKQIFEQVSAVQELFEAEQECGVCHHEERRIRFRFRIVNSFRYYSLLCLHCFAEFHFGQQREGGALFPKRKDDNGVALPNRGWSKYERKPRPGEQAAEPAPQAATPPASGPRPAPPAPAARRMPQEMPRQAAAGGLDYTYAPSDDDVPF